jgi:putative glycerol-1-phosphate prenyltransferase
MTNTYIESFREISKGIAVLIDPEKCDNGEKLFALLDKAAFAHVDYIFVGGSTVSRSEFQQTISAIRSHSSLPLIIFPGSFHQISEEADAILFLSLISGRNPDFLIGHHIAAAQELSEMQIEVLPTGYILIDGGTKSSVAYVSQTTPIPNESLSIIRNTALAGKLLGMQLLYLDAGSGAKECVSEKCIHTLRDLGLPIIVGGGIREIDQMAALHKSGASVVVIGNKLEEDIDFLLDVRSYKSSLDIKTSGH